MLKMSQQPRFSHQSRTKNNTRVFRRRNSSEPPVVHISLQREGDEIKSVKIKMEKAVSSELRRSLSEDLDELTFKNDPFSPLICSPNSLHPPVQTLIHRQAGSSVMRQSKADEKNKDGDVINTVCSRAVIRHPYNMEDIDIGFEIKTEDDGRHLVSNITESQHSLSDHLRKGDVLRAVNGANVTFWTHEVMMMYVKNMYGGTEEEMSLMIERQTVDENGEIHEEIIEVLAKVEYTSRGGVSESLKLFIRKRTGLLIPPIIGVKFMGDAVCWIKLPNRGYYLMSDSNGHITLGPIHHFSQPTFQFRRATFEGIEKTAAVSAVFVCTLRNISSNQFISTSHSEVTTVRKSGKPIQKPMSTKLSYADPTYFVLHQTESDTFYIESLLRKGYFLKWDITKQKMVLTKFSSDLSKLPGSYPDCEFDIITETQLQRSP